MAPEYAYYTGSFYGNQIPQEAWNRCRKRAADYVDYITIGRATAHIEDDDTVKDAICEIAEKYYAIEKIQAAAANGQAVTSESVGSYHVTYADQGEAITKLDQEIFQIAFRRLRPYMQRSVACVHTA